MDITSLNLLELQQLHLSYQKALKNSTNELEIKLQNEGFDKIEELAIETEIENFKNMIFKIENRINEINSKELRYSLERIIRDYGFQKKGFQVQFFTTSAAYEKYGEYVTGIAHFEKEQLESYAQKLSKKIESWTDGYIKFEETVNDNMSSETKAELRNVGFLASDIFTIPITK